VKLRPTKTAAIVLSVAAIVRAAQGAAAGAAGATVSLLPDAHFYYEGAPIGVRLVVWNSTDAGLRNPVERSAVAGLALRDAQGRELDARRAVERDHASPPREIAAGATWETSIDLSGVEPLSRAGRYELSWASPRAAAAAVEVVVLERYDSSLRYFAHVQTDLGGIDIRLRSDVSPVAVRAFVDLARAGYYAGSRFSEVVPDSHVAAGDPRTAASAAGAFLFPAELSNASIGPGTVVMKPVSPAPPANGPAFLVALREQPAWGGQVTVLGEVVRGFEVVERIAGRRQDDIAIRLVRISAERPQGTPP
jgi:cyclophilin family peptidyl-prolyl cis-trans isomerase